MQRQYHLREMPPTTNLLPMTCFYEHKSGCTVTTSRERNTEANMHTLHPPTPSHITPDRKLLQAKS